MCVTLPCWGRKRWCRGRCLRYVLTPVVTNVAGWRGSGEASIAHMVVALCTIRRNTDSFTMNLLATMLKNVEDRNTSFKAQVIPCCCCRQSVFLWAVPKHVPPCNPSLPFMTSNSQIIIPSRLSHCQDCAACRVWRALEGACTLNFVSRKRRKATPSCPCCRCSRCALIRFVGSLEPFQHEP